MKRYATTLVFIFALLLPGLVFAQNFDFNILPLSLNPAFTGLFDGRLRASALYKSQWSASKVSFSAYGASVDVRSTVKPSGYFAVGTAFLEGRAADASIKNFSTVVSGAYHRIIMKPDKKPLGELAVGLQAGYIQRNIDLSSSEYSFLPYAYHIGTGAEYFIVNAGLSFAQLVNKNFSYTVGLAGNNLNLMNDGTVNVQNPLLRLTPSGAAIVAANWTMTERLNVRPGFLHIIAKSFYAAGSEFRWRIGKSDLPQTAFVSVWYRTGHVFSANAGYEFSYFRVAIGSDYYSSAGLSSGNGGFQMVARYIMPKHKRTKPG